MSAANAILSRIIVNNTENKSQVLIQLVYVAIICILLLILICHHDTTINTTYKNTLKYVAAPLALIACVGVLYVAK